MDMPPLNNKKDYHFWIIKLGKALASKQYESALFCANEASDVAQTDTERAEVMNFQGDCLLLLQQDEEALSIYNKSLIQFQNTCNREDEPHLKEHIAKAFFKKIETLAKLERQAEIPPVCDEMICRFGADNTPFIRKYLAKALREKAAYFTHLAGREESLSNYVYALYDELIQKFGNDTDKEIQKIVEEAIDKNDHEQKLKTKRREAEAMSEKGITLYNLRYLADAIKAFDDLIQKFGNETDTEIKQVVAWAMYVKGKIFYDRYHIKKDAIKAFDELIEKFGNETDTEIKRSVAFAMYRKGYGLYFFDSRKSEDSLKVYKEDAIKAYDELLQKFGNETDDLIQKIIKSNIV